MEKMNNGGKRMKNGEKKMKKTRVLVSLLLMCLLLTALVACGGGAPTQTQTPADSGGTTAPAGSGASEPAAAVRDSLTIVYALDPGTLNPMGITGGGGGLSYVLCYTEPLYVYMEGGTTVRYLLAESVEEVGPLQFTMRLRQGVTFNNGNPFTAEDVLFTMGLEREHPSRMLDVQYVDWDKTKAADDHTIDLWFSEYTPYNITKLSQMLVMDAESFDEQTMSSNPIGTGAYTVTEYVVNSHIKMERRDDYWGEKPVIKTLNFRCLNEQSQVTNALEIGDVDIAGIPTKDAEYVQSLGTYSIDKFMSGMCVSNYYNMSPNGALASKEARDAVSFATDAQGIIDVVYDGFGEPVNYPSTMYAIDYEDRFANMDDTYAVGYDLEKAKEKAEQAGLVGKTIRIVTNGSEDAVTMSEIMQADLAEIGVTLEITNYDQATYYSIIMDPSQYDIATYFVSAPSMMTVDILANYPTFFTLGWDDSERLAYIAKGMDAQSTPDATERGEKLFELLQEFVKYAPWYSVCDVPTLTAVSSDLDYSQYRGMAGEMHYGLLKFK
jgi:peptide/nickel transport system substrate-binding protein